MEIIALLVALMFVYWFGRKHGRTKEALLYNEKMVGRTILEDLIRRAWYGAQIIARDDQDPKERKRAEKNYRMLDETYTYSEKRFELPMSIARLSELAKVWDECSNKQKEETHRWQRFLRDSS